VLQLLGHQKSDPRSIRASQLVEKKRTLQSLFDPYLQDFEQLTLDDLERIPEYQRWERAESAVLVLHGANAPGMDIPQSWLSLLALNLVERLQLREADCLVAYPKCGAHVELEELLKDIISEVVDHQKQILRRGSAQQDIEWHLGKMATSGSGRKGLGRLTGAIEALLALIERCELPIYVVVDRPELCIEQHRTQTWELISSFVSMVKRAKNQLRILVVIRTDRYNVEGKLTEEECGKDIENGKLIVLRRDQQEL
jgi:hypothetical protein